MTAITLPPGHIGHLTAAADYSSTGQFLAVIQTNQTAVLASALGQRCIGILQNSPVSGASCDVQTDGIAIATYGGTIAVGDRLVTNASGQLINAALVGAGATAAAFPIAVAIYAGVSGDQHGVLMLPPGGAVGGVEYWHFPLSLIIAASGDLMTDWVPGFAGRIVSTSWTTQIVGAGASASITMNAEIGTTNVTGGVVTIPLASTTPAGTRIAGSAVTAANAFTATDAISLEVVVGTAFTAGSGFLTVGYVRG